MERRGFFGSFCAALAAPFAGHRKPATSGLAGPPREPLEAFASTVSSAGYMPGTGKTTLYVCGGGYLVGDIVRISGGCGRARVERAEPRYVFNSGVRHGRRDPGWRLDIVDLDGCLDGGLFWEGQTVVWNLTGIHEKGTTPEAPYRRRRCIVYEGGRPDFRFGWRHA